MLARRINERSRPTGTFRLRSGVSSSEYFDKYLFEADPELLRDISQALSTLLPPDVDAVAGLELGGVPLATVVSQLTGLPARYVRKQAKTYGTCRLAEGGEIAGLRLAVIEDVVTSGGRIIESATALREYNATIAAAVCVIDREAGGTANLAAHDLQLKAVFTATQPNSASVTLA
jgi:orotate phosphoribosyltransferase